ncbi:hypothetical protein LNO81_11460 [Klebsiella variicola subsp. variicola]|nr:hypothetical protein [Klebsiella variicola subsp. variicola]
MLHELISLINVVIWPAIVLFFYVDLVRQSTGFLKTSAAFPSKGPGFEVEAFNKGG